jgi:hypothetical protein
MVAQGFPDQRRQLHAWEGQSYWDCMFLRLLPVPTSHRRFAIKETIHCDPLSYYRILYSSDTHAAACHQFPRCPLTSRASPAFPDTVFPPPPWSTSLTPVYRHQITCVSFAVAEFLLPWQTSAPSKPLAERGRNSQSISQLFPNQ